MDTPIRRRILWIEDDYYRIGGLMLPLKNNGFDIVCAASVAEAVECLSDWRNFDVIVLDLLIPHDDRSAWTGSTPLFEGDEETIDDLVRNSMSVLDYIRDTLHANIPVVVLSVVRHPHVHDMLRARRVVDILPKRSLLPTTVEKVVLRNIPTSEDQHTL